MSKEYKLGPLPERRIQHVYNEAKGYSCECWTEDAVLEYTQNEVNRVVAEVKAKVAEDIKMSFFGVDWNKYSFSVDGGPPMRAGGDVNFYPVRQIDFTFPSVAVRIKPKTVEVKYRLALMKATYAQEPYVISVSHPTTGCDDFELRQKVTESASDFIRWIGGPVTIQESLE